MGSRRTSTGIQAAFAVCLLGVTVGAGNPQCARSTDLPLTPAGTAESASEVAQCVVDCQLTRQSELEAANQQFAQTVRECDGNRGCIAVARGAHVVNLTDIHSRAEACLANCHNQGGATGGQ